MRLDHNPQAVQLWMYEAPEKKDTHDFPKASQEEWTNLSKNAEECASVEVGIHRSARERE